MRPKVVQYGYQLLGGSTYEENEKVAIGFGSYAIDCLYGNSSIGGRED